MPSNQFNIQGLSADQVQASKKKHGDNILRFKKENTVLDAIKSLKNTP